jgi:arylsulfatase A-like enzyme
MRKPVMIIALSAALFTVNANAKPNIIYINADDLGVMDVGFTGNTRYNTPNLNKLAIEGMVFTNAYSPSANCAPSRAACMSGQVAARTGVYTVGNSDRGSETMRKLIPIENSTHLAEENVTIAEALKAAGYTNIHLGKWHLGDDPTTQGFDINIGGDTSGGPSGGGYFTPFNSGPMKPFSDLYPKGTHRVDIFADQAIKFMKANKEKPFFMYLSYYSVHGTLQPVPEFVEKYKNIDGLNATYASMIEKMDQGIGKIITELDSLGLKDNTMVLFTSDNGGICKTSTQAPFRAGKGSYFEGGIRVPLFVRWPKRVAAGSKCDVPIIGLDFFPTFLDAAGADKPEGKILDGVSIMPLLTQSGTIEKRPLFWHFPTVFEQYLLGKTEIKILN